MLMIIRCKEIISRLLQNSAVALFTCIFALGGAMIGIISGGIKGHMTEIGLFGGVGIGAVSGAITGVQVLELIIDGEPFSKVAIIYSLLNGKIFIDWVSPSVFKAYQWQTSSMETSLRDISDIFEVNATNRGLLQDAINELPTFDLCKRETASLWADTSCAICLQDFKHGESAKLLPNCRHFFHIPCVDEWLMMQGICPICREEV